MSRNRLVTSLDQVRKEGKKIFSAFLTFGYPSTKATVQMIQEFEQVGVDVIELGFPFSDPMADGPTIQYSSEEALKKKVRIQDALQMVKSLRKKGCNIPIVFFTYLNPIFHYGLARFAKEAKQSGIDAVLVPDLPPEEETNFQNQCRKEGLSQIFLIAPTSKDQRMKKIASASSGFIYYVSLRGVTGARRSLPSDVAKVVKTIKRKTQKPVLIGFGVSSSEQAKALSKVSDGVIVGSAIIEKIRSSKKKVGPVVQFVKQLVRAVKS